MGSETEVLLFCPASLMPPFPQFRDLVLSTFRFIFIYLFLIFNFIILFYFFKKKARKLFLADSVVWGKSGVI